jgi:hypothetical protein
MKSLERIVAAKFFNRIDADELLYRVEVAKKIGVNQILVFSDQVLKPKAASILTNSGIDLWLIAPIFYHDDNQGDSLSAQIQLAELGRIPHWAICNDGQIAQQAGSWLKMVCPNDKEYLDYRIESFKPALRSCNFTGISLDFIRYFTWWEHTRPDTNPQSFRNSCFCSVCVNDFLNEFNNINKNINEYLEKPKATIEIASFIMENYICEWTDYKCKKIDKSIKYILAILRKEFPELKSNIHAVPYISTIYNNAIKSILGQDFSLLSERVDYISPMTYNLMMERQALWINDVTCDVVKEINSRVPVIPTIECEVKNDIFEESLINALKPPSSGVALWQFECLTEAQIGIINRILKNNADKRRF